MKITRPLAALLTCATVLVSSPAAYADPAPQSMTSEAIDAYVETAFDASGLPGLSIVVTLDDQVVYANGYGEQSTGEQVTAQTPMRIASMSKSYTAMAVMELVEDGKVQLDGTAAAQIPGFTMADARYADITVRQLLNQTSGITDAGLDMGPLRESADLSAYVPLLRDGVLTADPGERFAYCNVNYDLLARLVEVASGQSYVDYMRLSVFAPLGMTATDLNGDVSDGYIEAFGAWIEQPELYAGDFVGGSGNVTTTAEDLGRWLIAQQGTQLVTSDSLSTMHTPPSGNDYAMGWGADEVGGQTRISHAGNLFTYTGNMSVMPDSGYGFAVMTNSSAMYDESWTILDGLIAMSQNRTPDVPGTRWKIELVIGLLTMAAVALGVLGLIRARRWATRRAGRSAVRIALRLSPLAIPALLLAAYPSIAEFLVRQDVTWAQIWYRTPSVLIMLVLAAVAAISVMTTRVVRLAR